MKDYCLKPESLLKCLKASTCSHYSCQSGVPPPASVPWIPEMPEAVSRTKDRYAHGGSEFGSDYGEGARSCSLDHLCSSYHSSRVQPLDISHSGVKARYIRSSFLPVLGNLRETHMTNVKSDWWLKNAQGGGLCPTKEVTPVSPCDAPSNTILLFLPSPN